MNKESRIINPFSRIINPFKRQSLMMHSIKRLVKPFMFKYRNNLQNVFDTWLDQLQFELWREGRLIQKGITFNDITNQGKNDLLTTYFKDGTQVTSTDWVLGLINSSGFTGVAAGDTMSSHSGWTEFTSYSETNRVAWGQGTPASQSITNSSAAEFNMTATGTIKGIFVVSENTKGGTTGILWATALFSPEVPVIGGDLLRTTYTLST